MSEFVEIKVDEEKLKLLKNALKPNSKLDDLFEALNTWFETFKVGHTTPEASLQKEGSKLETLKLNLNSLKENQTVKLVFKLSNQKKGVQVYLRKIIISNNNFQNERGEFEINFTS